MRKLPDPEALGDSATSAPVSADRRELVKKGVYVAAAGCAIALTGAYSAALFNPPRTGPPNGPLQTYAVTWATSGASSAWANEKEGQTMRASDFPRAGLGAQGKIPEIAVNVLVCYLAEEFVQPSMQDVVPYGASGKFAAFRATCMHLHCKALWRSKEEAARIVPVPTGHDLIVCPCHLSTFDNYDTAKVIFGPSPSPLEQITLLIEDDLIKVRLPSA